VRYKINFWNERNPCFYLLLIINLIKYYKKTAIYSINWRKVGITSSLYGLYELGYRRATMVITKSCKNVNFSKSIKIT